MLLQIAEEVATGVADVLPVPTSANNVNEQISENNSDQQIAVASTSARTCSELASQNSSCLDEPPLTIDEFRMKVYEENPGIEYIQISRDNFIERLLGVYKNPTFNYAKKPMVEFVGESG